MSEDTKVNCALVYDFDGTLAKGNCIEWGALPKLGYTTKDDWARFWDKAQAKAKDDDGDGVLAYLGLLAEVAQKKDMPEILSAQNLSADAKAIKFFDGVVAWFERINTYARERDLQLEHYIISSGLYEMIMATKVATYCKKVFACKYAYTDSQKTEVAYPALAINYTTKTQFLFRINKGISNSWDNDAVNTFQEPGDRRIPFERMIFLGDGFTDIPSMKLVRQNGGHSIGVFDPEKWESTEEQAKVIRLISERRANYVVPADYTQGSQLDITVKGILEMLRRQYSRKNT